MRRSVVAWRLAALICEAAVTWMVALHPGVSDGVRMALILASRLALVFVFTGLGEAAVWLPLVDR